MNKTTRKIRDKFTSYKVCIERSLAYIGLWNTLMLLILVVDRTFSDVNLVRWFIPLGVGLILVLMFIGYIDTKSGIFKTEQTIRTSKSPQIIEARDNTREILRILRNDKEKQNNP